MGFRTDTFTDLEEIRDVWQTIRFQRPHRTPHPANERALDFNMGMMVPTVYAIRMRRVAVMIVMDRRGVPTESPLAHLTQADLNILEREWRHLPEDDRAPARISGPRGLRIDRPSSLVPLDHPRYIELLRIHREFGKYTDQATPSQVAERGAFVDRLGTGKEKRVARHYPLVLVHGCHTRNRERFGSRTSEYRTLPDWQRIQDALNQ
jgi:hypothetical protein